MRPGAKSNVNMYFNCFVLYLSFICEIKTIIPTPLTTDNFVRYILKSLKGPIGAILIQVILKYHQPIAYKYLYSTLGIKNSFNKYHLI